MTIQLFYNVKSLDYILPSLIQKLGVSTDVSTVAFKQESPRFKFQLGGFLHGVCMFSSCICGFCSGTLAFFCGLNLPLNPHEEQLLGSCRHKYTHTHTFLRSV
ncbi:hypothetical protein XENOCAPTIV_007144 [Xenoophorus captivus]|uniref:Uncharacterized protein n=1 Tax=Xenoophorus captivus TaxID=1517983 RepID=A0ABV0QQF9_9TELE